MSAFWQKIVWTVLAVGIYALTAVPGMGDVSEPLKVLAGLIVGAVWVARPGDAKLIEVARRSIPPAAEALLIIAFPLAGTLALMQLTACAGTPDTREVIEGAKRAERGLEHLCAELARTKPLREEAGDALDAVAPAGVDGGAPDAMASEQPAEAPVAQ
jgi:hypothetical protein